MEYLSVCSGIEAATVAWHPLGWQPVGFSEIEKFPSAVLAHHYPDVENYGDMNDYKKWPRSDIDVLVGGTPCQSFSVAGLRKGLADPRGNLALVYLAIADRCRPDWLVWENVPGAISSVSHTAPDPCPPPPPVDLERGGQEVETDDEYSAVESHALGCFLAGLSKLGYGWAKRVLDAQYFGVPQRRRRVFVVGYLGDWRRAAEVLFESESLLRNPPPSREKRQDIAPTINARTKGGGGLGTDTDLDGGLILNSPAPPLTGNPYGDHESREGLLIPESVGALCANAHPGGVTGQDVYQGRVIVHGTQDPCTGDQAFALGLNSGQENAVAFTASDMSNKAAWESEVNPTLNAQVPSDTSNIQYGIRSGMSVRRLTPLECERLQGFPDRYTDILGASDSARYKALGNSMAVPVMHWIGKRINDAA